MAASRKFPDELREGVIRMVVEARRDPATCCRVSGEAPPSAPQRWSRFAATKIMTIV